MAEEFKLPGSSYEEISRIIKGYSRFSEAVPLQEVAQVTKMHPTAISRNNGFLASIGIIEGGALKGITPTGRRLAQALEYQQSGEIASVWKEIIQTNEFLSKMLSAIRIRKAMDTVSFQGHIAYSAGQPRTDKIMTGAKVIIEILQQAALVTEKDGQLIAVDTNQDREILYPERENSLPSEIQPGRNTQASLDNKYSQNLYANQGISVNIEIRVDVKPNELENLGKLIKQLLDEISGVTPPTEE